MKYVLFFAIIASCAPKTESKFFESRKYLRQVKVDHINFFEGIKESWLMKRGKAKWILSFDEKDTLRYIFQNNKTRIPYWQINYINDSLLMLTRRRDLRYTVMDSVVFCKNSCLHKQTVYDQNRVPVMDSTTLATNRIKYYLFNGYVFQAYYGEGRERYVYFYNMHIVTALQELVAREANHPSLRFWYEIKYRNDTLMFEAKMKFFNEYIR